MIQNLVDAPPKFPDICNKGSIRKGYRFVSISWFMGKSRVLWVQNSSGRRRNFKTCKIYRVESTHADFNFVEGDLRFLNGARRWLAYQWYLVYPQFKNATLELTEFHSTSTLHPNTNGHATSSKMLLKSSGSQQALQSSFCQRSPLQGERWYYLSVF